MVRAADAPIGSVVRIHAGTTWTYGTVVDARRAGAGSVRAGAGSVCGDDGRLAALVVQLGGGTRESVSLSSVEVHARSAACARGRLDVPDGYVTLLNDIRTLPQSVRGVVLAHVSRMESIVANVARAAAKQLRDHPFPTPASRQAAVLELVPTIGSMMVDDLGSFGDYVESYYSEVEEDIENSKCRLQHGDLPRHMRRTVPFLTGVLGKLVGLFPPTATNSAVRDGDPLDLKRDITMRKAMTLLACLARASARRSRAEVRGCSLLRVVPG